MAPGAIVVLSQHDETLYAERALRAGARGYVMKQESSEDILNAIRTVMGGDLYLSRRIDALAIAPSPHCGTPTPAELWRV